MSAATQLPTCSYKNCSNTCDTYKKDTSKYKKRCKEHLAKHALTQYNSAKAKKSQTKDDAFLKSLMKSLHEEQTRTEQKTKGLKKRQEGFILEDSVSS